MRIIFYGLSDLTKKTATRFIEEGHEVLIIDPSRELIDDYVDGIIARRTASVVGLERNAPVHETAESKAA